jgi:predicted Fe-Mo cluster-binding NifX family protein
LHYKTNATINILRNLKKLNIIIIIIKWLHQPGAVPMFLKNQNIDCIIAGGMGPKAIMMLESFGIKVFVGVTGKIEEVIEAFIKGTLTTEKSLCEHGEHRCQH